MLVLTGILHWQRAEGICATQLRSAAGSVRAIHPLIPNCISSPQLLSPLSTTTLMPDNPHPLLSVELIHTLIAIHPSKELPCNSTFYSFTAPCLPLLAPPAQMHMELFISSTDCLSSPCLLPKYLLYQIFKLKNLKIAHCNFHWRMCTGLVMKEFGYEGDMMTAIEESRKFSFQFS